MDGDAPRQQRHAEKHPYGPYALISATYLAGYGGFVALAPRRGTPLRRAIRPLELAMLGLATLRLSRLAAWDKVTSFLRLPVVKHGPEDAVAGQEQQPRGQGWPRALGELVTSTTCIGTWIAAALAYGLYLAPDATRPFLTIMAAAGPGQQADAALALLYATRDRERAGRGQAEG
ncbi:MAG: DUF1360 domain-containing protein [Chloroflexota bacterium]|nr:DUF1360 domain-containing protein [Chloroflexota bacterium]